MKNKSAFYLAILAVIIVVFTVLYFVSTDSNGTGSNQESEQTNSASENKDQTPTDGKISGSFTYPYERIPSSLTACVETYETRELVTCSDAQIQDEERFLYGVGYEITVPIGKYYVYAKDGERKAYFNGYITLVNLEDGWPDYNTDKCKTDYQPIPVVVEPGLETDGANVGDWYYETSCQTN